MTENPYSDIPFEAIKKVVFKYPSMTMTYIFGVTIKARAPNEKEFYDFYECCKKKLKDEQVILL